MGSQVLAAVVERPGEIAIREFPMPEIGRDDGLLKVEMAGVCGSDPGIFAGKLQLPLPLIMGHEILGRIAAIGNRAARQWGVKEGDRVVVEAFIRCGFCPQCITGDYKACDEGKGYGTRLTTDVPPSLWGAYAQYMYLAPGSLVLKIAESVPAEAGALVCAVVANGIRWGRFEGGFAIGDCVVIQGCGQQGLAQVIAAKESGVNPIIITGRSVDAERLALARLFGAHQTINVDEADVVERVRDITGGRMADVVVDVAGTVQALQTSLLLVRKRGTLVSASQPGNNVAVPFRQDLILSREIVVRGVFASDFESVRRAVTLVESRKYPVERIVSHKYPLEQAETAVKATGRQLPDVNPIKVAIVP